MATKQEQNSWKPELTMDPATLMSTLLWVLVTLVMTGVATMTLLDWSLATYAFPLGLAALAIGIYAAGEDLKGLETWEIGAVALMLLFLVGIEFVQLIQDYVFGYGIYAQAAVAGLMVLGYLTLVFDLRR